MTEQAPAGEQLRRIIESAQRLGVEVDEADALQWLAAISAEQAGGQDLVVDAQDGVFGHRVSMLDFSADDLAHFRRIGRIVEIPDEPGAVETALALSGSSAQSKVQRFPGDCDYFERVNIKAPTREEACRKLGEVMRRKALDMLKGPDYQFIELKWGTVREPMVKGGKLLRPGSPISWTPAEVQAGRFEAFLPGQAGAGEAEAGPPGGPVPNAQLQTIPWSFGEAEPGWCKLDWVVADRGRGQLANASNMLDVTWEAPDGAITPLDGYIDPYFQEVYLDADSIPVFTKLVKQISGDALDRYVEQLRHEVQKWAYAKPNYGKVAKRLYNIFRLTGRYPEAAYLRELFDEPATVLYQVWSLLGTVENIGDQGTSIDTETVLRQMDDLIKDVVDHCEGALETQIIMSLLQLKANVSGREQLGERYYQLVDESRHSVEDLVNEYFRARLYALESVGRYLDELHPPAA